MTTESRSRPARRPRAAAPLVGLGSALALALLGVGPTALGDGPLGSFNPFRAAAPAADAPVPRLTERSGPWLIKTETFAGEHAEEQATELARELRTLLGRPTYLHGLAISHDGAVEGKGFNKDGTPKRMKYQNPTTFNEIVVLVGDFASVDDPRIVAALEQVKTARPTCVTRWAADEVSQRFYGLRYWQDKINDDPERKGYGPLRRSFAVRNPILPAEFFGAGGLDPFVLAMNQQAEFSLLRCPKKYTVRVATFRGDAAVSLDDAFADFAASATSTKLEEAAIKAHDLAAALRAAGTEAYEFHDRAQSIVCVGSYDDAGRARPDGGIEPNPEVMRIVMHFGAKSVMGKAGFPTLQTQSLGGISFDVQPLPIEVPRASAAQSLTGR